MLVSAKNAMKNTAHTLPPVETQNGSYEDYSPFEDRLLGFQMLKPSFENSFSSLGTEDNTLSLALGLCCLEDCMVVGVYEYTFTYMYIHIHDLDCGVQTTGRPSPQVLDKSTPHLGNTLLDPSDHVGFWRITNLLPIPCLPLDPWKVLRREIHIWFLTAVCHLRPGL